MTETKEDMDTSSTLTTIDDLAQAVTEQAQRRRILINYAQSQLSKENGDYNEIKGKKSLGKPGAEKFCALFQVTIGEAELAQDIVDTLPQSLRERGAIVLRTKLYKGEKYIGSGIGARTLVQDNGDLNKMMKMARKSSVIDAVISTFGLSDLFTQDLEDMVSDEVETAKETVSGGTPQITIQRPNVPTRSVPLIKPGQSTEIEFRVDLKKEMTAKSGTTYAILETDIGEIKAWKNTKDRFEVGKVYNCVVDASEWQGQVSYSVIRLNFEVGTFPPDFEDYS